LVICKNKIVCFIFFFTQAKFKGGDTWYAGIVQDLHVDGTYHILYEDGDEETSVKRDMIEPVEVFFMDFVF